MQGVRGGHLRLSELNKTPGPTLLAKNWNDFGASLKKSRFTQLVRLSDMVISRLASLFIPTFAHMELEWDRMRITEETDDKVREGIERKCLERALTRNISFLFEPRFRLALLRALSKWIDKESTYLAAKSEVESALKARGRLGSYLFSSHGLSRILMSYGFFSTSATFGLGRAAFTLPGLGPKVSQLGLLREISPSLLVQILKSSGSASLESKSFPPSVLSHFFDFGPIIQGATEQLKSFLVVGPGALDPTLQPEKFDAVIFLLTENANSSDFKSLLSAPQLYVICNNVFDRDGFQAILTHATEVFCRPGQVHKVQSLAGIHATELKVGGNHFFTGRTSPNMAQLAVGLAMRLGGSLASVRLSGVDIYTGSKRYRSKPFVEEGNTRRTAPFYLSRRQVNQNPMMNFLFLRLALGSGVISENDRLVRILSLSPVEYLEILDDSIGAKRA